mgnify:CR=1 FL=1
MSECLLEHFRIHLKSLLFSAREHNKNAGNQTVLSLFSTLFI